MYFDQIHGHSKENLKVARQYDSKDCIIMKYSTCPVLYRNEIFVAFHCITLHHKMAVVKEIKCQGLPIYTLIYLLKQNLDKTSQLSTLENTENSNSDHFHTITETKMFSQKISILKLKMPETIFEQESPAAILHPNSRRQFLRKNASSNFY